MATGINDLVLIYVEEKPSFYARIEDISPDIKAGWWKVTLLALAIPPKILTWILEEDQINGKEFTMGGIPVRLEKVISPISRQREESHEGSQKDEEGKVIHLFNKKKTGK